MASTVDGNPAALAAQRHASRAQADLTRAITRLSSGLRINSASDDAAGLAISERFTAQIRGISQASRNTNDGISLTQTADGSLASIGANLQRVRELAVQAANGSQSASDRASLQLEVSQLVAEVDRVAAQTGFNGISLLDGSFTARAFQVGANSGQTIVAPSIASARTAALGFYQGCSLSNQSIGVASNSPQALSVTLGGQTIGLGSVNVDARQIAAAVNGGGVVGLSATANATSVAAGSSVSSFSPTSGNAVFTINGVAISIAGLSGFAMVSNLAINRDTAVAAINAQTAATGVVATNTSPGFGGGVSLAAADGRNITTSYSAGTFTNSNPSDFGLAATGITGATLNLNYVASAGIIGTVTLAQASGATDSMTIASTGTALTTIDVSTVSNANAAITTVDAALATVNSSRASLGALENRFGFALANAQASSDNLSAARGRIVDADFAEESASLARSQVLLQAGLAMISQANQLPQQVLELLRH